MISWFSAFSWWTNLGAGVGVILSLWALVAKLDKALRSHLAPFFVTRKSFERLEEKVDRMDSKLDTLIEVTWRKDRANHE